MIGRLVCNGPGDELEEREKALELIADLSTVEPGDMSIYYDLALASLALGDQQAAIDSITRAVQLGYPTDLLARDIQFTGLREQPQFIRLLDAT